MKIHCKYDALVDPKSLKFHPRNPNKHTIEQFDRFEKIVKYQGWRQAIKISNLSGFITSGNGRVEAAILKSWDKVPVVYQDYEDADQEYADLVADNSLASWSELNYAEINLEIPELGPEFDIDYLGVKNFFIDASDKFDQSSSEWNNMPEFTQEDRTAFRTIRIHFHNQEGVKQFERAIEKNITDKTRFIWYPEIIIEKALDKTYSHES